MNLGLKWIKQHPIGFIRFAAMKAVRFFSPLPQKAANLKYAVILTPYAIVIVVGFFVGLPTLWSKDPKSILVLLLFVYTLAIEMIFMTATRHRLLYDPFFVLVGFNYVASRNPLRKRRQLSGKLVSNLIDARPARSQR